MSARSMRVLVRGLGNIGTTLANLLLEYQALLGIDEVIAHKTRMQAFLTPDVERLRARGATVFIGPEQTDRALASAHYIFDCRQAGAPRADRDRYEQLEQLRGASAQGTEIGFGAPFVSGVNDGTIADARLVQIASCNTHALATLMQVFAGARLEHLHAADFVIVRRAEDLGNHERLVSGTVVARHRSQQAGTHHAEDAARLFASVGLEPTVTSSDVTAPSQLMHTVRFGLRLTRELGAWQALDAVSAAGERIARTDKFDSNRIFELGRRYGFQGRIYAHAIVVANNLLVAPAPDGGCDIRGWAFVPQEGNTLLSTLHAFLLQTRPLDARVVLDQLRGELLLPAW